MVNNSVFKNGALIGYRCHQCQGVFTQMWGTVCNGCRDKNQKHAETIEAAKASSPETTVLIGPWAALIAGLFAVAITVGLMLFGLYVLQQLREEWALNRAAGLIVAEYQLVTAQISADSFNANPVPGPLQCLPSDVVHADMVVQR